MTWTAPNRKLFKDTKIKRRGRVAVLAPLKCDICHRDILAGEEYYPPRGRETHVNCVVS